MRLEDERQRSAFNDLQIEKTIQEQKQKELNEKQRREQLRKREEMEYEVEEFKNNSLPFFKMDILLLLTIFYSLIICLISVFKLNILLAVSCLIICIFTFFVGKSSYRKYQDPKLTNIVLWNLSQSLFDFINIKIPFEVLTNKDRLMDISTILSCIVFLTLKSNTVFYALVMTMFILSIIIAYSMKDIELIYNRTKIVSIFLFLGLIVKTIMYGIISGVLYLDMINVLLLNIFTIIKIYTNDLEIHRI